MRKLSLIFLLNLCVGVLLTAQRNFNNEILVYFNTGVKQEISVDNGKTYKTAKIFSDDLKDSLSQIGIDESMIEVEAPNFKLEDTLKVLPDGVKLYKPDMTKLYRIVLTDSKNKDEIIKRLILLHQVGMHTPMEIVVLQKLQVILIFSTNGI
jgi:hypothetical protein